MNDETTPTTPTTATTPTAAPAYPGAPAASAALPSATTPAHVMHTLGLDPAGRLRRRIWHTVWLVVTIGLITAVIFGVRSLFQPRPVEYETHPAIRDDLTITVTASGTLEPVNTVDVGSELSGTVAEVLVDYNSPVQPTQVLARLRTELLKARVREAEAQLAMANATKAEAQATAEEAQLEVDRVEPLKDEGLATDEDFVRARAALLRAKAFCSTAAAQIAAAQAALDVANTNLGYAEIRSPIKGVVLQRNIEPGQSVVSSLQAAVLFQLAESLEKMELHLDIDEADIGHVKEGQAATFTVAGWPDRQFPAKVLSVRFAPTLTENVVTYQAILEVDNSDLALRPGMTATAHITTDVIRDALLVPNAALRFEPPGVETGELTDGHDARVWILRDGLPLAIGISTGATAEGRTVVTSGNVEPGAHLLTGIRGGGGQ